MDLYQVCSNGGLGPWGPKWPCGGGVLDSEMNQNLLLQNCLAQVLEIWYVALPGGPLPSLFK